jgi:hypothetical protein
VVDQLQPFIVTSWHGHRDDADIPAPVRRVWGEKFDPRRRARPSMHSNVISPFSIHEAG